MTALGVRAAGTMTGLYHALRPETNRTFCGLDAYPERAKPVEDLRRIACIKCRRAVDPAFKAEARKPGSRSMTQAAPVGTPAQVERTRQARYSQMSPEEIAADLKARREARKAAHKAAAAPKSSRPPVNPGSLEHSEWIESTKREAPKVHQIFIDHFELGPAACTAFALKTNLTFTKGAS